MQSENRPLTRATASSEDAARWLRFDRAVQKMKALHADIPAHELQAEIDEACAAARQEMGPWVDDSRKERS